MDFAIGLTAMIMGVASVTRQMARRLSPRRLAILLAIETVNLLAAAALAVPRPAILIETPLATIIVLGLAEWGVATLDLRGAMRRRRPPS